ncbi:MAG: DUF2934 domain-containing protein [Candidatus Acidiferrum sp.]|jgi:hypothetical protein
MKTTASAMAADLNANPLPIEVIRGVDRVAFRETLQRSIADRAYDLFQESGSVSGNALSHWLQAEKEILNYVSSFRESGAWIVANLQLSNVVPEDVKVFVDQNSAVISLEEPIIKQKPPDAIMESCYIAEWPAKIDPATASAYLKNGTLTLEVKKKL